ncbi:MAG: hypothetical protein R3321_07765 [Nitrososphaeraceae archaeon]|nr:hypothetical protein [Nitrososphaeraceae archaeon]
MNIIKNSNNFSLLIIGIALIIIGLTWIWVVFYSETKPSEVISLYPEESTSFNLYLTNQGLAYYKISIINYDLQILFIQIIEPKNNVIAEQKIHTKMSVNFFEYDIDGNYVIRITNVSEKNTEFLVEFGDSKSEELVLPLIPSIIGSFIVIYIAYRKMMTYSMEHP